MDVRAAEAVDELDHLHWGHQEAVEEDVLHVEMHAKLFGLRGELADGLFGSLQTDIVGNGVVVGPPGNVDGPGHHEQVVGAQVMCGLGHLARKFEALRSAGGIVCRQRIGPKQK